MKRIPVLILALGIIWSSCQKSSSQIFPTVQVNEYLDLNLPSNINLNSPGGWIYYPAGNKGLLVYRLSGTEFAAFDRTCTYDPTSLCGIVYVDTQNQSFASDTCCKSKFNIIDGAAVSGPASQPLVRYNADYLTNNIVHIYN